MIKLILETFLGGTMERMLKHNNGLTAFNTLLAAAGLYIGYQNYQLNELNSKQITNIRHALYYKMGIQTDAPDKGSDQESKRSVINSDVALVHQTKQSLTKEKAN